MSVGFLDWDLTRWRQPTVFSLEIMKLAYYYKTKQEVVKMFFEFEPDRVDKIYVYKDYEDFIYPEHIVSNPKAIVRGLAMTNNVYTPLDDEIEFCPADPSIYSNHKKFYRYTGASVEVFKNMSNACHLRMSLDGEKISSRWHEQLTEKTGRVQHVVIHDLDVVNIAGADELLKDLAAYFGNANTRLGFKYPVKIYTDEDAVIWGRMKKTNTLSNLYLMNKIKDLTIDDISILKQKYTYYFTPEIWTKERFLEEIPNLFLQGLYLSKWNSILSFSFDPAFVIEKEWKQLIEMLNNYFRSAAYYRNELVYSVFAFAKYSYGLLQREEKIPLFQMVREQCPELFHYLYEVEFVELQGGDFIPHMYTWGEVEGLGGYGGHFYQLDQEKRKQRMMSEYNYAKVLTPDTDVYLGY